jgi:hypothetical protein
VGGQPREPRHRMHAHENGQACRRNVVPKHLEGGGGGQGGGAQPRHTFRLTVCPPSTADDLSAVALGFLRRPRLTRGHTHTHAHAPYHMPNRRTHGHTHTLLPHTPTVPLPAPWVKRTPPRTRWAHCTRGAACGHACTGWGGASRGGSSRRSPPETAGTRPSDGGTTQGLIGTPPPPHIGISSACAS